MNHPSELISAFLDGELSQSESAQLHSHLSSCGRCAAELQDVQRVRAAIRSLPVLDLPTDLLLEGEPNVTPIRRHRVLVASAAAVVAVVIAMATIFSPTPQSLSIDDVTSRWSALVTLDPASPVKHLPMTGGPQE